MKKVLSYTGIFVAGFIVCILALKTLGDTPVGFMTGNTPAKRAVLASLTQNPVPLKHFAGDSVVADAAAKVEPAVVEIHTVGKPIRQAAAGPFDNDPMFRQFFGMSGRQAPPMTPEGAGSGVIISPDGYVLTNNHVVADAQTLTVSVGDNQTKYTGHVIGTDPVTDLAVVKINTNGVALPVAQLGDSSDLRVGDWAIAVGNPLNVGTTVTLGIISAKNRSDLPPAEGQQLLGPHIQTDAAINPGNSGGALANINGQVIGINEAILAPNGTSVGIGFAIPINTARTIAYELIKNGKASHPYLGIRYEAVSDISSQDRPHFGIPTDLQDGVVIASDPTNNAPAVFPGSPAAQAGLHAYDVISQANGQKLVNKSDLDDMILKMNTGDVLHLEILRDGKPRSIDVSLRERPTDFGSSPARQRPQDQDGGQYSPFSDPNQ